MENLLEKVRINIIQHSVGLETYKVYFNGIRNRTRDVNTEHFLISSVVVGFFICFLFFSLSYSFSNQNSLRYFHMNIDIVDFARFVPNNLHQIHFSALNCFTYSQTLGSMLI